MRSDAPGPGAPGVLNRRRRAPDEEVVRSVPRRIPRAPHPLGLLLALLLLPASGGAEIYRWTDAEGRLHFTERLDRVPPAHRAEAERNAARGARREVQTYRSPAAAAPGAPAARTSRAVRGGREIHVPFVRDGSLMRVDVLLNDTLTAPFLIDTGASGISLPSSVADRLGIRIHPDTPVVQVRTASGIVARPVVTLESVQLAGARVEGLSATVNPAMEIGLLGGSFFNNFVYRVDAAHSVISLAPNDGIRGGLGPDEWRQRFRMVREPLGRLDAYVREHPDLSDDEREILERRREELASTLAELEEQANRLDVPQRWRD